MSSIDTVTASFAASLALGDGEKTPDLGKIGGGPVRHSSQSFLLAKPLTRRVVDPEAFKSHFARVWVVQRNFRIQERGDLFLVSFESEKDRTKVLKGGAWCFDRAPVCLKMYDGITPMTDVPMRHVRMWVIVSLIPPWYEEPDNLRLIGNLLEGYLDYDRTEFRKGVMKILFTHEIHKPLLLERCSVCNMITHAGEKCDGTHTGSGYAFSAKPITGVAINPAPVVSSTPVVKRKPACGFGNSTLEIEVAFDLETSPIVLEAAVGKDAVLSTTPSKKRGCNGGCSPSLKKIKTILGGKLLKHQAESLGLVDIGGDDAPLVTLKKKKLGCRLGSRNKVSRSTKKTEAPLRITYSIAAKVGDKASPNAKGKGKGKT
ncbi:hypothetical protein ACLB2K_057165 [Fragaria x ananassa]